MVRFILCGLGDFSGVWLDAVGRTPAAEFTGFVEINTEAAEKRAAQYNLDTARFFPTLEDALSRAAADAVIIVTPPDTHRDLSIKAMQAGLHVLSEKPLADSMAAAQDILDASRQTGMLHVVTQNYRYFEQAQTLKAILDSGEMGAVSAVHVSFFKGWHFDKYHDGMPYPLLLDESIHHFDLMRFLLGANAQTVYARSWNPGWSWYKGDAAASAVFGFPGGITASYDASWVSTGRETPWNGNWRFECENGVLLLEDDEVFVHYRTTFLRDHKGYRKYDNLALTNIEPVDVPGESQDVLLREFISAVNGGALPATACTDNIHSLQMVFSAVQSAETGQAVQVS